ncbi:MAG: hypothetical protein KDC12_01705 [Flavobacteriales bacterium]|nr:hypothetical protein [Flavobacteriales bacterium]
MRWLILLPFLGCFSYSTFAQDLSMKSGLHVDLGIPLNGVAFDNKRTGFGIGFEVGNRFYIGPEWGGRVRPGFFMNWVQVNAYGRGDRDDFNESHLFWEWHFLKTELALNFRINDGMSVAVHAGVDPMIICLGIPLNDTPYYYHNHGVPIVSGAFVKWKRLFFGVDTTFGTVRVEDYFVQEFDEYGNPVYARFIAKDLAYNRYRVFGGFAF